MLQMIYHTVSSPILTSSLSMEELEKVNGGFAPLIALKGFKGSDNNEKSDGGNSPSRFFLSVIVVVLVEVHHVVYQPFQIFG